MRSDPKPTEWPKENLGLSQLQPVLRMIRHTCRSPDCREVPCIHHGLHPAGSFVHHEGSGRYATRSFGGWDRYDFDRGAISINTGGHEEGVVEFRLNR